MLGDADPVMASGRPEAPETPTSTCSSISPPPVTGRESNSSLMRSQMGICRHDTCALERVKDAIDEDIGILGLTFVDGKRIAQKRPPKPLLPDQPRHDGIAEARVHLGPEVLTV